MQEKRFRIEPDRKIVEDGVFGIFDERLLVHNRRQSMVICDKNIALAFVLKLKKPHHRAEIIADMYRPRRLYAGNQNFFILIHNLYGIKKAIIRILFWVAN